MNCRACGSSQMQEVLNMGQMPLAGDFHNGPNAKRYPLEIDRCPECDVLQVRQPVPHEVLFNAQYCYSSSTVPSLVTHFKDHALKIQQLGLKDPFVLEIGCNDGVLLKELDKLHIQNVGVDSSPNVIKQAQHSGCAVTCMRFNGKHATELHRFSPAGFDVVTCSNCFAHNTDPNDFLQGVKQILKPGGYLLIEVHDADVLRTTLQWDCFYHEHCFNWTEYALRCILKRQGFTVQSVTTTPMHGGALLVQAIHQDDQASHTLPPDAARWNGFAGRVQRSARVLEGVCDSLWDIGKQLYVFGAAGRATMLINYAQIGGYFVGAFDGSPLRAGKAIPGTSIHVFPEDQLAKMQVDYCMFGAWHIEKELLEKINRIAPITRAHFITPLPCVRIS